MTPQQLMAMEERHRKAAQAILANSAAAVVAAVKEDHPRADVRAVKAGGGVKVLWRPKRPGEVRNHRAGLFAFREAVRRALRTVRGGTKP